MHAVRCPECRSEVSIDPADLGHAVACPLCGERFTARAADRELTTEDDAAIERPRRRRRWDEEDDYDEERPSRSRERRRLREVDWDEAERISSGPANGLILTGWISAALCLLGGLGMLIGGLYAVDAADPELKENGPLFIAYGLGTALLGTPYFIVMAIGGHKFKHLTGIGWVYTAAVLGIITIGICGPCIPLTWAAMPIGIWTIVAVGKPDVKAAFKANRED